MIFNCDFVISLVARMLDRGAGYLIFCVGGSTHLAQMYVNCTVKL